MTPLSTVPFHASICITICLAVAVSWVAGAALARDHLTRSIWGFLVLASSADISLVILKILGAPPNLIVILTAIVASLIIYAIRRLFRIANNGEECLQTEPLKNAALFNALLAVMSIVIYIIQTVVLRAEAQINFFHAWYPQYVSASFSANHFLVPAEMGFGSGFLTSAMQYAPNTLGFLAFLNSFRIIDLTAAYLALNVLCVLLMNAVLFSMLARNRLSLVVYALLFFWLPVFEHDTKRLFFIANSDELLFLGGAFICYHLFRSDTTEPIALRLVKAAAVSLFLVLSRNYGAFYACFFIAAAFWANRRNLTIVISLWLLLMIFCLPELVKLVEQKNIFYARENLIDIYPFSWSKLILGTLVSWGILNADNGLKISVKIIYLVLLVFFLTQSNKKTNSLSVIMPFVFLLLPLFLELITSYRKDISLSKLYTLSAWFFVWFPAYIVCKLEWQLSRRHRPLLFIAISVIVILGVIRYDAIASKVNTARMLYLQQNITPDSMMAEKLLRSCDQAEIDGLRHSNIMYFHYEPGIGVRKYIGGNFFTDLDFWSDSTNASLSKNANLKELLEKTGCPNLYMSFGLSPLYQKYVRYSPRPMIWKDLERHTELPFIKKAIVADKMIFVIPDRSQLSCGSSN